MSKGKCVNHQAIEVQIADLKTATAEQWTHINAIKKDLQEMPRTKTLIGITAVVVVVLVAAFGIVWAKMDKAVEATYRIDAKIEKLLEN